MNKSSAGSLEQRKYLFRSVRLNPATQADQIIAFRRQWYGLEPTSLSRADIDPADLSNLRQNIADRIELVRSQFWIQPAAHLKKQISGLPVQKFPDLAAASQRLNLLLVYRDEINGLSNEKYCNSNLLFAFKQVVMSSPRKAGKIKERYLRSMSTYTGEHSQTTTASRKKMVKMLRKKYPELYQLESAWFDEILRAKTSKPQVEHADQSYDLGGSGIEIPGWLIGTLVLVVIRVVFYLLWNLGR